MTFYIFSLRAGFNPNDLYLFQQHFISILDRTDCINGGGITKKPEKLTNHLHVT